MGFYEELKAYTPTCEQEEQDKALMLRWLAQGQRVFTRECESAHFTASAWVVSPDYKQVFLAYHKIYNSWAWLGGHADGDTDLLAVARREVQEESGLEEISLAKDGIYSVEVLHVPGHVKKGKYVSSHLHLNVTYLFTADPAAPVRVKPDENSAVGWFPVEDVAKKVTEAWMTQWVYSKLMKNCHPTSL